MRPSGSRLVSLVTTAFPCAAYASTSGGVAQLLLPTVVAGLVVGAFTGTVVPEGRYRYGILFIACAIFIAATAAVYIAALDNPPYSQAAVLDTFVLSGVVGGAPFLIAAVIAAAFFATE